MTTLPRPIEIKGKFSGAEDEIFEVWKSQMLDLLSVYDLQDTITEAFERNACREFDGQFYVGSFNEKRSAARFLINHNTIGPAAASIKYMTRPLEIWTKLLNKYGPRDARKRSDVALKLRTMTFIDHEETRDPFQSQIYAYISYFNEVVQQYQELSTEEVEESFLLSVFIDSCDNEYPAWAVRIKESFASGRLFALEAAQDDLMTFAQQVPSKSMIDRLTSPNNFSRSSEELI